MYTPAQFNLEDRNEITRLIRQNSFAALVTNDAENGLTATHIPFLYDPDIGEFGRLTAHIAKANPQWQDFSSNEDAIVIFSGPHAYISPSWYVDEPAVPTWNYAAIHAYGKPEIVEEDAAKRALLFELIEHQESGFDDPWKYDGSEEFLTKMVRATVAFRIDISRLDAKAKLGQNRTFGDQKGTNEALRETGDDNSAALADLVERLK